MASLIDAIKTLHSTIEGVGQITGGCWYDVAPKETTNPSGTFAPYTEFFTEKPGEDHGIRMPTGGDIERFFGGGEVNTELIGFQVTALSLATTQTLTRLLFTTFDNATLAITDNIHLNFLAIHRPLYDDLQVRREGNYLYRGTATFQAVSQD